MSKLKKKVDIRESIRDLLKKSPFLGYIVVKMKPKKSIMRDHGAGITRDVILLWSEEYFEKWTLRERAAVLEHEARHIAHRHFDRLTNVKHPHIAIVAKEISINQYIEDIPKGCPKPEDFNLGQGHSLEEYYKMLVENAVELPASGKNPLNGDIRESPSSSTQPGAIYEEAKSYAKSIGDKTGEEFEKIEPIPTNWKMKMRKMAGCQPITTKYRKTYMKRSKRYAGQPGIRRDLGLGKMIVGLDTSGSMGSDELGVIWDAIKKTRARCSEMILIQVDTEVKDVTHVRRGDAILEVKGRGGTELTPIITKAQELGFPKVPLVVFTDGEVSNFPTGLRNSLWVFTQEDTYRRFKRERPEAEASMLI